MHGSAWLTSVEQKWFCFCKSHHSKGREGGTTFCSLHAVGSAGGTYLAPTSWWGSCVCKTVLHGRVCKKNILSTGGGGKGGTVQTRCISAKEVRFRHGALVNMP